MSQEISLLGHSKHRIPVDATVNIPQAIKIGVPPLVAKVEATVEIPNEIKVGLPPFEATVKIPEVIKVVLQTAEPIQLRVELAPPVAPTFARDAADFIDGTNITISGKYGYKTVIISPAGAPSAVEYEFAIPVLQDYELSFHYAAKDARPFYVIWNGRKQPREVITETSMPADWIITPAMPRQRATTVAAKIGINTLRLERNGPFPHIATIFLTPTHG